MIEFKDTPLGIHGIRNKWRVNFIDKFNDFWMWQDHIKIWGEMGRPDPFDAGDVPVVQFMRAQMGILNTSKGKENHEINKKQEYKNNPI